MSDLIVVIGLDEFILKMDEFPEVFKKVVEDRGGKFAEKTQKGVQSRIRNAPRVDLGELLHGIHYEEKKIPNGIQFTVKPSDKADKYAIFVEKDTRPHFPPIRALQGWADRHNIPVYAVAMAIAKHGTKGIHMFEEEFKVVMANAQKEANRMGKEIVIELTRV
jgi:hypothetical protein